MPGKVKVIECKKNEDGSWFVKVDIDGREYSDRMSLVGAKKYLKTLEKSSTAYKFFNAAVNEIKKQKGAQDAGNTN